MYLLLELFKSKYWTGLAWLGSDIHPRCIVPQINNIPVQK